MEFVNGSGSKVEKFKTSNPAEPPSFEVYFLVYLVSIENCSKKYEKSRPVNQPPLRADEIVILCIIFCVWAAIIKLFLHRYCIIAMDKEF